MIKVMFSNDKMDGTCEHGPKTWPWWRVFGLHVCRLDIDGKEIWAGRLWLYRPKTSRNYDLFFTTFKGNGFNF